MPRPSRQAPPRADTAAAIADRLHSTAIHLLRRLRVEDAASALSAPPLSALSVIVFRGPISMGALAAAEQVRPPTISRLVSDLERRGLVRRETDPEDARVQRLTATEAGERVLAEGRARRVGRLAAAIRRLPAADRAVLRKAGDLLDGLVRGNAL